VTVIEHFTGLGWTFTEGFGMTELSPAALFLDARDVLTHAGSVGRPFLHVDARLVSETGEDVGVGEVGELVLRGPTVFAGYWNRPEETATALRGGWMHTGDGGRMDDEGYVYVVDRIKDMIVSGGENVYSVEVENALARHPGVASCAVIGVPDDEWGERVHAVVVPAAGATPTAEELREHVKGLIAGYKAPGPSSCATPCRSPAPARSSSASCAPSTGRRTTARCRDRVAACRV